MQLNLPELWKRLKLKLIGYRSISPNTRYKYKTITLTRNKYSAKRNLRTATGKVMQGEMLTLFVAISLEIKYKVDDIAPAA